MESTTRVTALLLGTVLVTSCGDGGPGESLEERIPRSFEAGDLDPYGCPYVEPAPWVGKLAHARECGQGCEPSGANSTFVACVSPDTPRYPDDTVSQVVVCMVHPVTGDEFQFGTPASSYPYDFLCWAHCGRDGPFYFGTAPDECFEEASP